MAQENGVYQSIIKHVINMHRNTYKNIFLVFFHIAKKNMATRDMNVYFFVILRKM